jgi:histidinol-phosphate/aromatic aminotransferase/cobyric acid decarboxylase-like protein
MRQVIGDPIDRLVREAAKLFGRHFFIGSLVAQDKDVIVLRTFSKIYGMAGLRAGAAIGRPDLLDKMKDWSAGAMPVTGMVGATASLRVASLVPSAARSSPISARTR